MGTPIDSERGALVVKLGGAAISTPSPGTPWALGEALAALHRSCASGVVLVHGGGAEVDRHLARVGMKAERRDGLRVTPPEQIEDVASVLAGRVSRRLVAMLGASGAPAVGLFLGDASNEPAGNAEKLQHGDLDARSFTCALYRPGGADLGLVGELVAGTGRVLHVLLRAGYMPVVSSIGALPDGRLVNINADDAADGIARITRAAAIVLLTDVPGVLDRDGTLLPSLDAERIESLIARGVISGGMIPKVRSALASASTLGAPAIIASWKDADAVRTLASGRIGGTVILPALSGAAHASYPTEPR